MEHEKAFVQAFILPDKKARYLAKLSSRKHRDGFLARLDHHLDFDPAFATQVPAADQTAQKIEAMLRSLGALDACHVISTKSEWDNQDMPLHDALNLVCVSSIGTVVCCVPGRLAYYEAEDIRRRYIFKR